jgi:hypothetical protein
MMNILITNLYREYLTDYDFNIIKEINGQFDSKELVEMLKNIIYDKLIIDLTAIKDYQKLENIRELSTNIESSKIILLLSNESITTSEYYIANLVSQGIYNFTLVPAEIGNLINYPRNYEQAKNINFKNINNN